jgi:hypothetical protein
MILINNLKSLRLSFFYFLIFGIIFWMSTCGCFCGVYTTGTGWHIDLVIHNGVIHTARYNYDRMSVEYAYKPITENTWHIETVEKFPIKKDARRRDRIDYNKFLKIAVDDETVYIAYAGLEGEYNVHEASLKLARREKDGRWDIIIVETERIKTPRVPQEFLIVDFIVRNGVSYILLPSSYIYAVEKDGNIKKFPLVVSGYIWGEGVDFPSIRPPCISPPFIFYHKIDVSTDNKFVYISSVTAVPTERKIEERGSEVRYSCFYENDSLVIWKLNIESGEMEKAFSYPISSSENLHCPTIVLSKNNKTDGRAIIECVDGKYLFVTENFLVKEIFFPDDLRNHIYHALGGNYLYYVFPNDPSDLARERVAKGINSYFYGRQLPFLVWLGFKFHENRDGTYDTHRGKMKMIIAEVGEGDKFKFVGYTETDYEGKPLPSLYISYPYIVLSFTLVDESEWGGEVRGTHMIYIFDGKSWRKEVVK